MAEDTTSIIHIEDVWRRDDERDERREAEDAKAEKRMTWQEENFLYRRANAQRRERARQVKLMKALVDFVGVRLD